MSHSFKSLGGFFMGKIRLNFEARELKRVWLAFTFTLISINSTISHADYLPVDQFFSEYSYIAPSLGRFHGNSSQRQLVSLEADTKELLNNALRLAAREDRLTDLERLISRGANVNTTNSAGMSPLMLAARNCSPKMTEILLKAKADVNATDDTGRTPLIFATRESCSKVVELLIKAPGIRCLTKDRSQKTALDYASDDSRLEVDGASQTIMGLILFSGKS
jgi:hypothetical protein